ncbi:MAG: hypothetical protein IKP65_09030 [Alphaproteobacteria bacterium]|nr:hypothetical protein [Alphaproteobacteria bacterium]
MEFKFYVNPEFVRNGGKNIKIMVKLENIGWFGVFYNTMTKKIQRQFYKLAGFNYLNVYGNGKNKQVYSTFKELQSAWCLWNDETKKDMMYASCFIVSAFEKYKWNLNLPSEQKQSIYNFCRYFKMFVNGLYNNNPIAINQTYESGYYTIKTETQQETTIPEQKTETPQETETRKSIRMFKLVNASNLANLYEGNFYPIIRAENGYYTVKDDKGNDYTLRANRGREIQVYTEL